MIQRERQWHPVRLGAEVPAPAGAYSPAARAGGFVFVSGQIPRDPVTGEMAGDDIESQTRQVIRNVERALNAAGAALADVVSVIVYIRDFFLRHYATRAFENACFAVVCNQAGRSGYLDCYPPGSPNQPNHAGGAAVFDPLGNVVVSTKANAVREEMLVADLDPERMAEARSDPNYQLRRRRAELFRDLAR